MPLTLHAEALPLLRQSGSTLLRALLLEILAAESLIGEGCGITVGGTPARIAVGTEEIHAGQNQLILLVEEVQKPQQLLVRLTVGEESIETTVEIAPARRWRIHLVLHSHTDLGFTAPVSEVARIHNLNTDHAIELCRATASLSDDERFRWTCEVSWQIQNYLRDRSKGQIEALMASVREGAIEIGALYAGEHTDLLGHEQSIRALSYASHLRRTYTVPIETVLLSDVPGCTSGFVQVMAKSGIRNFLLADNNFIAPFLSRSRLPRPFTWKGADDTSILCWYTDHPYYAYAEGELYGFTSGVEAVLEHLPRKLLSLEASGYGLNSLLIQYAFDNAPLDPKPADIAREWNRLWTYPRIRLSTPREFFDAIRVKSEGTFPVVEGDWTSWWASIAPGFPVESALTRELHDRLPAAEMLQTFVSLSGGNTRGDAAEAPGCYDLLLAFDEHSGGGGLWKPESPEQQARAVREGYGFLFDAKDRIEDVERGALGGFGRYAASRTGGGTIVLNLLPWERSGVPPYGFKAIEQSGKESGRIQPVAEISHSTDGSTVGLENSSMRLLIDPQTGNVTSLYDRNLKRELLHSASPPFGRPYFFRATPPRPIELGKYIAEVYNGTPARGEVIDPRQLGGVSYAMEQEEDGHPLCIVHYSIGAREWCAVRFRLDADDQSLHVEMRVRSLLLEEPELAQVFGNPQGAHVSLYVPFGFEIPDATIAYESPNLIQYPPEGQIDGSCMDFYAVQHWLLLTGSEICLAFAGPDTPLVDIGSPGALMFKKHLDEDRSVLHVRLADLTAWGSEHSSPYSKREDLRFRFSFRSFRRSLRKEENLMSAHRLGWEAQNPLKVLNLDSETDLKETEGTGSFLHLEPEHVQVLAFTRPARKKGYLLRLQEMIGSAARVRMSFPGVREFAACRLTISEEPLGDLSQFNNSFEFHIRPHSVETIQVVLPTGERM